MLKNSAVKSRREPSSLWRLWSFGASQRSKIVWAIIMSVSKKVFDIAPEILIGFAIDVIVQGDASIVSDVTGVTDTWQQLLILAALNFVVWVAESLSQYVASLLWRNIAQTIEHNARMDAYAQIQDLEMEYFEDASTGGLLATLIDDVNQLERFLDDGANKIIQTTVNIVGVAIIFFAASPLMALVAFMPIPVIIGGSAIFQRRLAPLYDNIRNDVSNLSSSLTNNITGIATIRAFATEKSEVKRIEAESEAYRTSNKKAIKLSSAFIPMIRIAILVGFTSTLLIGGWKTIDGTLAVGFYSVLVFMTQRLLWPLTELGEMFDLYQRAMASSRRIFALIDSEPTIVSGNNELHKPVAGKIDLVDVHFAYGENEPVLSGLDLKIGAGETHAIVGLTGSGKSTIVKLLLRFYEPTSGQILIDNTAIESLKFDDLRGATGLVSQDVFLFSGTVAENIAYGRPDATRNEIEQAAQLAEAHDYIAQLANGYDTVVGERGQKLSGGQRQRLSIARAILRDPPVLVLDEATSSVDNETEAAIQRSLEVVAKTRTTLIIAHRLSTVRNADQIHVLEHGKVSERGTHDELVKLDGLYAALWNVQTGVSKQNSLR